ncbi:MAG: hypothetical protein EOP11_10530 [Proteobacteria bacterium]|nr:MAG: hypothetical protein EOP11_10530 [Pseudomonadota bacterium]
MLKKAVYLSFALTLSACGSKSLPAGDFSANTAAIQASEDTAPLINDAEEVATLDTSEEAALIGPEETVQAIGPSDSAAMAGAPETSPLIGAVENACPAINGSFVLTIGGEISDRITIHSKQDERGRMAYSINNGAFYGSDNKVYRSEKDGVIALARVACERDLLRLNYRDSSGARKGLLEVTVMGEGQLKIINAEGSIATSGNYLAAQ